MKKFSVFPLIAALAFFVSCQKQQTEEERKAEVERQVQDRLAAERVEAEKQRLAQDKAALEAREKALADREAAAATTPVPVEEPVATATAPVVTERSETRTEKRSTAAYGMFYEKLDNYGEWRETSDYGYVWQPREAEQSRDWRPYTEGRWVYSDAGWTWVSDEPFGWATYHYGRWLRLRKVGWVWVPGDEWAPAWVSWRTNKDYVGWAPLPPEARFDRRSGIQNWADSYYDIGPDQYSFVSSNEFGNEHVRRSVIPTERNSSIVIETTNVTRITFANASIVNEGPNYDELRPRSRRPIERYRLRRDRNTEAAAIVRGDELEVSVPLITEVRDMPRPRRLKERVVEINIDNGWTVADRSAAERARTKIRTEATPPPNAPPKVFVKPTETSTATASATPAATAATTPTPSTAASPTPAATTSPTPVTTTASPTATAAAPASATPSATPRTRPRPTPSATPAATAAVPTPAATPMTAATATPAASATVRARPSPTNIPKPSPSIAPVATATPAATSTPATAITPAVRVRPSPPVSLGATPTPIAKPSLPPAATPPIQRRTPPPLSTPVPTAPPLTAPETPLKPSPTLPPVKRPSAPPRTVLPTPSLPPSETSDAAHTPVPKRIMPPRMTPPPAVTTPPPVANPSVAPTAPPVADERAKNRKPKRPGETETGTPTPAPSTPPN